MTKVKAYGKRLKVEDSGNPAPAVKITSSQLAAQYAKEYFFEDIEIFESFFIMLLNRANVVIGWAKISQGGVSGTFVDGKIVAKYAVDSLASAVILLHNHPSGNLTPSMADINLTKKIKAGLSYLDIQVLDHVIITKDDHYSMADEGNM